ncbi:MAG: hypothetical protein H6713_18165 [Myxococcales bacterium]|nr:hypothetical protein [Myxococcales bacterium]
MPTTGLQARPRREPATPLPIALGLLLACSGAPAREAEPHRAPAPAVIAAVETLGASGGSASAPADTTAEDPSEHPAKDPAEDPTEDPTKDPTEDPGNEPALAPGSLEPATLRWLAAGGGALPEHNQVSIEQDLALASSVLGERGLVLFAGGPRSPTVQVQDPEPRGDELRGALAELFAPRGGRDARYRESTLPVAGVATADAVLTTLAAATREPGPPLLVVLAGHGERGEDPGENFVDLWAQSRLRARELAELLDGARRPTRMVVTTCFSGGFAELAFRAADPGQGAPETERCGLFATTWDLEASGCDPNPDRRAQEGYGLHFFNALAGRDRDGAALPRARLDLDGDGRISPLEAHARARVASRGIDVPTTTSERWLRQRAPAEQGAPSEPAALPEERVVIEQLAAALELTGREHSSERELAALEQAIDEATRAQGGAQELEDAAYRRAAAAILARWPVLDDPWHPDFEATLARHRDAIRRHLDRDPAYAEYLDARAEVDASHEAIAGLRQRAALHERLARALENRVLAGRLRARGGPEWTAYERLLACERAPLPDA